MSENKPVTRPSGPVSQLGYTAPILQRANMFVQLYRQAILSFHLLRDERVPIWLKAVPVLTVIYAFSPLDFFPEIVLGPFGVLDDLTLVMLAFGFFIQQAPPDVVDDHARRLGYIEEADALEMQRHLELTGDTDDESR